MWFLPGFYDKMVFSTRVLVGISGKVVILPETVVISGKVVILPETVVISTRKSGYFPVLSKL